MESLGGRGAIPERRVQVPENSATNDLGELKLGPVFDFSGRVHLSDGKAIPANTQIILSRADLNDSLRFAPGPDGRFRFSGVPPEKVTLYLRVPDYELTAQDATLMAGSSTNFTVVTNVTALIEMRPRSKKYAP